LAPEVFAVSTTSKKTDVWAMGMTIYRLLNGDRWYREFQASVGIDNWLDPSRLDKLEELVMSGKLSSKLCWMPHVPDQWRRFVNKALHHDQHRRYQNGGEMLSAIATLGLSDSPSWICEHADERIVWRRVKDQREQIVLWERANPRRNSFEAYSQRPGDGGGRSILVKNSGPLPRRAAADGLYEVFLTRMR
jgi:serine/threonine-protein kinase